MSIRRLSTTSITSTGGKSSKLWDQETTLGTYESIATATCTGNESTIVFSNIPQNYAHLQIRAMARTNRVSAQGDYFRIYFNSDTNNNYSGHDVTGWSSSLGSGVNTNFAGAQFNRFACSSQAANNFGIGVMDIFNYSSTTKYKTTRSLGGWSDDTAGEPQLNSALWLNANAISSITIGVGGGTLMTVNSIFSLYGIRGA